jgi:hypothetical protein
MFHVKHFGPVAAQNLTRQKTEILLGKVRTARILVQSKSAGESRFFGVAGARLRRNVRSAGNPCPRKHSMMAASCAEKSIYRAAESQRI